MADLVNRPFAVFDNPDPRRRAVTPYIVALKSPWLQAVSTVVVAPLRRREFSEHLDGLQVPITFGDERLELLVLELAHIPAQRLRQHRGDLAEYDYEIRRGLDCVFTGF